MYKILVFIFIAIITVFVWPDNTPEPIKVELSSKEVNFLKDVKPILDKRCVTCHACYDAPCQAKFSSFDGVDRGGSKAEVYRAKRLLAQAPTRLFIDAKTTAQWREKKFFSLTQNTAETGYHNSIMGHVIEDKALHPDVIGNYEPQKEKPTCSKNLNELGRHLKEHPNQGMPYGFPALDKDEHELLMQWLVQGAKGPSSSEQTTLERPSKIAAMKIKKWESFLNEGDAKHQMTARYLYEHFFIANINFKEEPNELYHLIRSSSAFPDKPDTLQTLRPYDKPEVDTFYYRFEKVYSTKVDKTNLIVVFDDAKLKRFDDLFIQTPWLQKPHVMKYTDLTSANPFIIYEQIPPLVRSKFLLDHNAYITRCFIRGPICKGNVALSVIRDHFWILFQDPKFDIGVQHPEFLQEQIDNLRTPIESGSFKMVTKTFSDEYSLLYKQYYDAKVKKVAKAYPDGWPIESIWRGRNKNSTPILSAYRHFDSATLYPGAIGELPGTMWLLDYAQFERLFYTLVVGFDVFGNVSHQLNVRRYMDFLRLEGELNIITYMPAKKRAKIFSSWYEGDDIAGDIQDNAGYTADIGTRFSYKSTHPKQELMEYLVNEHFLKSIGTKLDPINYFKENDKLPPMPKTFHNEEDLNQGFRALSEKGLSFIKYMVDGSVNVAHMRVNWNNGKQTIHSMIINRWHDNVNALRGETKRLDSTKDTLDVLNRSVSSYPNIYFDVNEDDLSDFFDMIKTFKLNENSYNRAKKYAISRANPEFWKVYDWFQKRYYEDEPLRSGLYDLNRYYKMSW